MGMPGTALGMPLPLDEPLDPPGVLEPLCPEDPALGLLCPEEPDEEEGELGLCDDGELLGELLLGDGRLGEGMLGELGGGELLLEEQPARASAAPSSIVDATRFLFQARQ